MTGKVPTDLEALKAEVVEMQKETHQYIRSTFMDDRPNCVDLSGKDLARACFLSYDPEAKMNIGDITCERRG